METDKRILINDKSTIITRKIRLYIDIPKENKEELNQAFRKLYDWQAIAFKASNLIASHLYFQEQAKEILYFNENIKLKLADCDKDKDGMLNTSRENTTYRIISKKFKNELPSSIAACLNHSVYSNFIKEKAQYFSGTRSLRSYKSNIAVPLRFNSFYDLRYDNEIKNFRFLLFKKDKYSIPFRTYLGRDLSQNKIILERCVIGEYKLCDSAYKIENGKISLFVKVRLPTIVHQVDPKISVQAKLSFLAPVIVSLNEKEHIIGDKESFLYKRLAIQHGLNRRKQLMKFNKGGRGRIKKVKGVEEFEKKEKNFITDYTHNISHELVKFCLANKAGKLVLKDIIQSIEETQDNPFVLRNWSYGNLRDKIEYKCKMNNIELVLD